MTELIEAKVARILNNTDLALNKGETDGVEVGMKFAILSDVGERILDPDTGEELDSIQVAKTVVKVIHAAPRSCIARTFRSRTTPGLLAGFAFGQETTRTETLASDENRAQQELDPRKAKVKVGDFAIEYTGTFSGIVYDF